MASQMRFSVTLLIGGAIAWGGLSALALAASGPSAPAVAAEAIAQNSESPQGYNVIHVNALSGNDGEGDGSQLRPLKTITQALRQAEANTLILLAKGVYSAESGETFPLALKPRVTVQGMSGPNAADIAIVGNGGYYSNSSGLRNITILGADNAGLANITVSNPHPEGTGLWIESGSPIILDNAFFQSGLNGVYIAGHGSPVIRGNYFSENGNAGLVIAGPSSAQVQGNVFENTGTGITIAPEATPQVADNRISSNLDGLIIHADARPTLQNNQISRNRRNSVISYATWVEGPEATVASASQPPPPNVSEAIAETAVAPAAASVAVPATNAAPVEAAVVAESAEIVAAAETTELPEETSAEAGDAVAAIVDSLAAPTVNLVAETHTAVASPEQPDPAAVSAPAAEAPAAPPEPEIEESAASPEAEALPSLAEPDTVLDVETAAEPSVNIDNAVAEPNAIAPSESTSAVETPSLTESTALETVAESLASSLPVETAATLAPAALTTIGDGLASNMTDTSVALTSVDIALVPAVTASAALAEVDLRPVIAASEAIADNLQNAAESASPEDAVPTERETPDTSEPNSTIEPSRDRAAVEERSPSGFVELPIIPPPAEAVVKPDDELAAAEMTADELSEVVETTGSLPALPASITDRAASESARLPVPASNIPVGSGGNLPDLFVTGAGSALPAEGPPPPPSLATSLGLNYKVLIAATDTTTQARVREEVPDAFRTRLNGQLYIQAGAYPTQEEAQAMAQRLNQAGLPAEVKEVR